VYLTVAHSINWGFDEQYKSQSGDRWKM